MFQTPALPAVINQASSSSSVEFTSSLQLPLPNTKKMIILHTKDLTKDDLKLLNRYGQVVAWSPSLLNVDLSTIQGAYILVDANDQNALNSVEPQMSSFNVCAYVRFFEINHFSEVANINIFSEMPSACALKADFDNSLINKRQLLTPNKIISCMDFFYSFVDSLKKQ